MCSRPAGSLSRSLRTAATRWISSRDLFGEVFTELAGVGMPPPLAPAADPVADDPAAYVGRYERAGLATEVFEGADGLVLRSTITGPLAELLPEPVHEYASRRSSRVSTRCGLPGTATWIAVTFYALEDGARYVHYGARANPFLEPTRPRPLGKDCGRPFPFGRPRRSGGAARRRRPALVADLPYRLRSTGNETSRRVEMPPRRFPPGSRPRTNMTSSCCRGVAG